jgi:hypothetical protein
MPLYNFKAQFAPLVESGEKRQVMRRRRKRPTRPGHTLMLYTGMRTKNCRLLAEGICNSVEPVKVDYVFVYLNGKRMTHVEAIALARADGFLSVEEMVEFFEKQYGLPVDLELIKW